MTEALAIAIVGALLTIVTAIVAPTVVGLNRRIRRLEHRDRLSWLYIRSLIDHAYRYSDTTANPLPLPPEGWQDEN